MQYQIVNLCLFMIEQEWKSLPHNMLPVKDVGAVGKPHWVTCSLQEFATCIRGYDNYMTTLATCYFVLTKLRPFF